MTTDPLALLDRMTHKSKDGRVHVVRGTSPVESTHTGLVAANYGIKRSSESTYYRRGMSRSTRWNTRQLVVKEGE